MEVYFFRNGKRYYYIFENQEYEVNEITINKLKSKLKLPFVLKFKGMSISQVQKVCSKLKYDNMKYLFNSSNNQFVVNCFEEKRFVDVYHLFDKSCMFSRNPNCKVYILNKLGDKNILMEVTRDYINNTNVDYYFLHSELTSEEREFFCVAYERIEVDYVYNITYEDENVQRRKRK